jgi:serine O-acetyltransferase
MFNTSLSPLELTNYLVRQLNFIFPDGHIINSIQLEEVVNVALLRLEQCFSELAPLKYYRRNDQLYFNHLNGDHYAMFLYLVSNTLFKFNGDQTTCEKIFLLNKSLFGIDAFYSIELPAHFIFVHPVGTILGNASYGDYLVVYQGVTIGATTENIYPTFMPHCVLYSNASVIGDCVIGQNTVIAARAFIINKQIDSDTIVTGSFPTNKLYKNSNSIISKYFKI